jgi:hypothetical protein
MGRGKSIDTPAAQARRMPFVAKIKRQDLFRPNDAQEIDAMCRRIAASSEYQAGARIPILRSTASRHGRRRAPCSTGSTAAASLTGRCPSSARRRRRRPSARVGLATGAVRDIVQAYRRARHAGIEELTSFNAACTVGLALGRPNDEVRHTVEVLLEWARENHREWFYRFEPPAAPARETIHPARAESPTAPDEGPLPPRHSPRF